MDHVFTHVQQFITEVAGAARDQLARFGGVLTEAEQSRTHGAERLAAAVDESAQLARASVAFWTDAADRWAKLTHTALERTAQLWSPPATE